MQLPSTTLTLLLASASLASAGCFGSGEYWGGGANIQQAHTFKDETCISNLGGRSFRRGEERTSCFTLSSSLRVEFRMTYTGNDAQRTMSSADCRRHLGWFIDNCGRGGNGESGPWSFK